MAHQDSILFCVLAAICNAVIDIVSHKFNKSIFNSSSFNAEFWDAEVSWRNKYINGDPLQGRKKLFWIINYPVQITDAWHLFKTLLLVFIFFGWVSYQPIFTWYFDLLLFGTLYNCTFSLFYNKILLKKYKNENKI